jgi:hypothetical protein
MELQKEGQHKQVPASQPNFLGDSLHDAVRISNAEQLMIGLVNNEAERIWKEDVVN